jgi:DNA ligase-1
LPDYINQRALPLDKQAAQFKKVHPDYRKLALTHALQKKYDGCQLIVHSEPNVPGRTAAFSRTGKQVKSVQHLIDAVARAFGPGWTVFGEAWMPGTDFATISGKFRQHEPAPELQFVVYDVVSSACFVNKQPDGATYATRFKHLCAALHTAQSPHLIEAATYNPGSYGDPQQLANQWVNEKNTTGDHFDGAILRDPAAAWELGDAKLGQLIKVKPHLSFTLRVIDFELDVGEKTGRQTAALVCRFKDNKYLKVGSGLTHAQQADPGQLVGRLIEVEATEWSSDGLLREPRFKGVRDDVKTPDF